MKQQEILAALKMWACEVACGLNGLLGFHHDHGAFATGLLAGGTHG